MGVGAGGERGCVDPPDHTMGTAMGWAVRGWSWPVGSCSALRGLGVAMGPGFIEHESRREGMGGVGHRRRRRGVDPVHHGPFAIRAGLVVGRIGGGIRLRQLADPARRDPSGRLDPFGDGAACLGMGNGANGGQGISRSGTAGGDLGSKVLGTEWSGCFARRPHAFPNRKGGYSLAQHLSRLVS